VEEESECGGKREHCARPTGRRCTLFAVPASLPTGTRGTSLAGAPPTMAGSTASVRALLATAVVFGISCKPDPPGGQIYFDRAIAPILTQSCARGTSGCHAIERDDPFAMAAGNLDVTSFASLHLRPDLLRAYGSYPVPMLLLKAVAETEDLRIVYG